MGMDKIDAAVAETIADAVKYEAELVTAISETASERVEAAENMAAEVIASAETTALGVKLAALEERINSWPDQSQSGHCAQLLNEVQELKNMTAELLDQTRELTDLLTEWEETEEEPSTPQTTPVLTPAPVTPETSRLPDEKSASPDLAKPKKSRLI